MISGCNIHFIQVKKEKERTFKSTLQCAYTLNIVVCIFKAALTPCTLIWFFHPKTKHEN